MVDFRTGTSIGVALGTPTATAIYTLGLHVQSADDGKCYRYVKFVDAITYVVGHLCTIASATTYDVSNDRAGGAALAQHYPVGFIQGTVPTEDQFGFVQCGGIVANAVMGSASVIAGDFLMADATEDGDLDEAATGAASNIAAVALATIADNAAGVVLCRIAH